MQVRVNRKARPTFKTLYTIQVIHDGVWNHYAETTDGVYADWLLANCRQEYPHLTWRSKIETFVVASNKTV